MPEIFYQQGVTMKNLTFLNDFQKIRFSKSKKQILIINETTSEAISISSKYVLKMLFSGLALLDENKKASKE
jgi:hypothetical protein